MMDDTLGGLYLVSSVESMAFGSKKREVIR